MRKLIGILTAVFFTATCLWAQTNEVNDDMPQMAVGLFGHVNFNSHNTDILTFPDCPTCSPFFNDGNGVGMAIGGLFTLPIHERWFLDLRLGYFNLYGKMTTDENVVVNVNGAAVNGVFTHTLEGKIATIGFWAIASGKDSICISA
jgi:hypothetical protein